MATEVNVRKWGNSMGIVLPKELVAEKGIKEDDKVVIELAKKADLNNLFGSLKREMSGQDFKNMVRKGW